MKRRLLWSVLVVCAVGLLSAVLVAQDEATSYDGSFQFDFPAGYTVQGDASDEFVQVADGDSGVSVYGPGTYITVLSGQTFADDTAALAFFADRSGLTVGDAVTTGLAENELARIAVTLPRREQRGLAGLFDLGNGRSAVVVGLGNPRMDADAYNTVAASLVYPADIIDVAGGNPDFSTLLAAIQAAGLEETLRTGDYTVFAPTNAAFEQALAAMGMTPEDALANTDMLTQILTYHVVEGGMASADLVSGDVATVQGDTVKISVSPRGVQVNNAKVITADVAAGNGVIHAIDRVLLPPDVAAVQFAVQLPELLKNTATYAGRFSFNYPSGMAVEEGNDFYALNRGVSSVNFYGPAAVAQVLGGTEQPDAAAKLAFFLDRNGFTVSGTAEAPEGTAAAATVDFARRSQTGTGYLLDLGNGREGVLVALSGRDGFSLALRDFVANQFISTINYPPDIIDIAGTNADISTFVAAVQAAGLEETLRGGSYTVFAPNNAAFEKALLQMGVTPADAMANTDMLTQILTYHVVEGALKSGDLASGAAATVQGDTVTIEVSDSGVQVNDASVVAADAEAANGVLHVVDKVLLPPDIVAAQYTADFPTLLKRNTTYRGRFTLQYATGVDFSADADADFYTLGKGQAAVSLFGPAVFARVLGGTTQPDAAAELAFFLDRNGFTVSGAAEAPEGAAAAAAVDFPRRSQTGTAYLLDLGNGRKGVLVALAGRDGFSLALRDFVASQVISTISYPADVIDAASSNPDLSMLVAAVQAAGLEDTLRSATDVTIFAPTNAAFVDALAKLGVSAEDAMANTELLTGILQYHVATGTTAAADLVAGELPTMLEGQTITVATGDATTVDGANIVTPDMEVYNGLVHVVDQLLVPNLCAVAPNEGVQAYMRVGASEGRARFGLLPAGPITVIGKFTDEAGLLWYEVDPAEAAPGRSAEHLWVDSAAVTTSGPGCSLVVDVEPN